MNQADQLPTYQANPGPEGQPSPSRPSLSGGFPGSALSTGPSLFAEPVFGLDDPVPRFSLPKISHWSIAWSDLMMTMFILFLSMFVYQAAHREFLVSDEVEVVGGETVEAVEVAGSGEATLPFSPIKPGRPLVSEETVKKVEQIRLEDIEADTDFFAEEADGGLDRIRESFAQARRQRETGQPLDSGTPSAQTGPDTAPAPGTPTATEDGEPLAPGGLDREDLRIERIFTMSNQDLAALGLENFATVDLVPDDIMRIILTGDLLFETGRAELSPASRRALTKIAAVIKHTPYLINVVGHTDNIPMHSEKYATNWELSVARASTVARFLIEEMGMNPNQFLVSGYGPYRPVRPNTNARNRAANRRVEIIISKRLPAPIAASAENIN